MSEYPNTPAVQSKSTNRQFRSGFSRPHQEEHVIGKLFLGERQMLHAGLFPKVVERNLFSTDLIEQ